MKTLSPIRLTLFLILLFTAYQCLGCRRVDSSKSDVSITDRNRSGQSTNGRTDSPHEPPKAQSNQSHVEPTNTDVMRQRLISMIRAESDPDTAEELEKILNDPQRWDALVASHPLIKQFALRLAAGEDFKSKAAELLFRQQKLIPSAQLQAWAAEILSQYNSGKLPKDLPASSLPKELLKVYTNHSPRVTVISPDYVAQSFVQVDWGGGWGHWGFMLGLNDFSPTGDGLYLLRSGPGVFVYHTSR
jgi:hypothetical protein